MSAHLSSTLKKPQDTTPPLSHLPIGIAWPEQAISTALSALWLPFACQTYRQLWLSSLADFWPLYLHLYPACLLCRKGSCCTCTQNIYFSDTNSLIAKYSCRNESLPYLACTSIYYHCQQQHWSEPLNKCPLVICYQKWPRGATLTQLVDQNIYFFVLQK